MKTLRSLLIAFLSVVVLATGVVRAATTTDYSDQWWVASESGWGASVLQQSSTLFINLMVYDADGKPTWFVAAASLQANSPLGHTVFLGDLYSTTGPWFGGPFDPARVGVRKVGTLTFDATGTDKATVSYSVDGPPVVKNVSRQTWSYENLGGTYDAVWLTRCLGNSEDSFPFDWAVTMTTVRHGPDNAVTVRLSCPMCMTDFSHEFRGRYTQAGHLGNITADLVAPDTGSITISEVAKTAAGFTGRLAGNMTISGGATCQTVDGRIGATIQ